MRKGTLSEEEHAFNWERSTTDLNFAMGQLTEKHWEFSINMVIAIYVYI
jgi:hypothetical protein